MQVRSGKGQFDQDGQPRFHVKIKAEKRLGRVVLFSDEDFRRIATAAQVLTPPPPPPTENHELTSPHVLCSQVQNLNKGSTAKDGADADDDGQAKVPPPPAAQADAPAPAAGLTERHNQEYAAKAAKAAKAQEEYAAAEAPAPAAPAATPASPADNPPAPLDAEVPEPGTSGWKCSLPGEKQNVPRGFKQVFDYYKHLIDVDVYLDAGYGDGVPPFTSSDQRLHQWALKEEIHQASNDWQPLIKNDEPIDGDECVYDQRRLAFLAVKWMVITSFVDAERKDHEPQWWRQINDAAEPLEHSLLVDYALSENVTVRT